jgi:hypothetical protein
MRRAIKIAIVIALWAPAVVLGGGLAFGAGAQDFSGFDMGAKAGSVEFVFNSPSLGIPAHPTGELDLAYSEASLQSGPSGYGLGSILWPGQVAAAVPSFVQGDFENQCGCKLPVNIPNWPVRAETFYPQGPGSSQTNAGTVHMSSVAKETYAEGVAALAGFGFPAVAEIGAQSSMSSTGFDPQGAVSIAEASASDITILGGLVTIGSVVTEATARSDGAQGSVAGTTTVAGAEVKGIGKVVIDRTGVHVAEQSIGTAAAQQALNQILRNAGMSIELSAPVDTVQGARASRSLGGVVISIQSSVVEPAISALPEPLQSQIRSQITFDQTFAIQIAPAAVTAGAAKSIAFEPPPVFAPTAVGGAAEGGPSSAAGAPTAGESAGTSAPSVEAPSAPVAEVPLAVAPARSAFHGVPVWLVVLLVAVALVSSRPLTILADRLLSARAGAVRCPDEAN